MSARWLHFLMTSLPRRVSDACYFREAYRMQRSETQKWLREFQCPYKQDTVVIKKKKEVIWPHRFYALHRRYRTINRQCNEWSYRGRLKCYGSTKKGNLEAIEGVSPKDMVSTWSLGGLGLLGSGSVYVWFRTRRLWNIWGTERNPVLAPMHSGWWESRGVEKRGYGNEQGSDSIELVGVGSEWEELLQVLWSASSRYSINNN